MSAHIRSFVIGVSLFFFGSVVGYASEDFNLNNYGTTIGEDAVLLNADLNFSLPPKVKDALNEGVDLVFAVDVDVSVPKEWLPDQQLVNFTIRKRLGYHALTKKYTVDDLTYGDRNSYHSLSTALTEIGRLRNVNLLGTSIVKANEGAIVKVRVELLISELPFPLRFQAAVLPEWYLKSPWFAWKILR